ncbi:MAG: tRNA (adenosine(37)-N6)-threonylcarbamoyltransferase complex dimerization subunit type 1 TsaB [Paracoccaceae bacterium]|nr:tRNA (adenosine(37)-N6)-threonylcarbamoyltransferase complex dimerization subunit type 1 TsaB [Paracoccaceae bacterium]
MSSDTSRPETARVLAFDTSAAHCAVAVIGGNQILAQAHEPMTKGQAERLLVLCQEVMTEAGLTYDDLSAIGVGIGPGNFTGIRISVSAARGLALGLGIPAVGISSLEALQYGAQTPCVCAIDARREQVYAQVFDGKTTHEPKMLDALDLKPVDGRLIGHGGAPAAYPVAEAIARLSVTRFRDVTERPAPLYMRPADAAPARDAPPRILA